MQPKILHIRSVNDYARYVGAPVLHELVSVIHYDELTAMRHSLNSYEVYAMFLNDGELPELTYGTVQYTMPHHTLMCVSPGQIGGRTDTGEIVHASGWALLFDPKLLHDTFLGKQMSRYRFFSYNTSEPLLMTDTEWHTVTECLELLRTELRTQSDNEHSLPVIASWLSLILEYCLRYYGRQFRMQSTGEHGLLHRLEKVLETYYENQMQTEKGLPTVSYCASQLCLSAGYFGDLVRETTGNTAIGFIHEFVIRRANELLRAGNKASLRSGAATVSSVAYDLGILDYCKQNGIEFWGYMVLEQGALSGKYNTANPLPADSDRGRKYNPVLPQLHALTDELTAIGKRYGLSCSQTAIAWAMTKGVQPIIGATKPHHVTEAAQVGDTCLTPSEVAALERLAAATGIDTRGGWEGKA